MTALLRVDNLSREFELRSSWAARLLRSGLRPNVKAVEDVSFAIEKGRTFALVGESGSGKSTIARMTVGLMEPSHGTVRFESAELRGALGEGAARGTRRRLQMIFQDPYASLNPRWRVRDIVGEPLHAFGLAKPGKELDAEVARLLGLVGLSREDSAKYPHQFSGGQRQRISIARALANKPDFIVCDEPTSALDVSVQAQILNLLRDLQDELGLTYLFISHDLAVVNFMADEVGVLYLGRLIEIAPPNVLFAGARHPYTRSLLSAVPDLATGELVAQPASGEVPNPVNLPGGCSFHPRCAHASERCRREVPAMVSHGHIRVACHGVEEGRI